MLVEWDVPIAMDDGVMLRTNVFRPDDDGSHPVVLSYARTERTVAAQEGYPHRGRPRVGTIALQRRQAALSPPLLTIHCDRR
jgi:predicted acyl esterase